MVKLRGVNVWPEAVGAIALEVAGTDADWFVRAVRDGSRDAMVVSVTSHDAPETHAALARAVEQRLKDRLGVSIGAEVVAPGALDTWTEVGTAPKLKRFRDER
jgi:phenylacetate-CoA ligase